MLNRILCIISEGHIASVEGIAEHLDVDQEIVLMMIEDLTRTGLLRKTVIGGGCSCCSNKRDCSGECNGIPGNFGAISFWELM